MARAQATTDHKVIRKWVEARGGHPASVSATKQGRDAGLLRIDFDPQDESLKPLEWDEFFEKFDENELAFLYQEKTGDGKESRFFKLVDRNSVDLEKSKSASASKKRSAKRSEEPEESEEGEDQIEEDDEDEAWDEEDDDEEQR